MKFCKYFFLRRLFFFAGCIPIVPCTSIFAGPSSYLEIDLNLAAAEKILLYEKKITRNIPEADKQQTPLAYQEQDIELIKKNLSSYIFFRKDKTSERISFEGDLSFLRGITNVKVSWDTLFFYDGTSIPYEASSFNEDPFLRSTVSASGNFKGGMFLPSTHVKNLSSISGTMEFELPEKIYQRVFTIDHHKALHEKTINNPSGNGKTTSKNITIEKMKHGFIRLKVMDPTFCQEEAILSAEDSSGVRLKKYFFKILPVHYFQIAEKKISRENKMKELSSAQSESCFVTALFAGNPSSLQLYVAEKKIKMITKIEAASFPGTSNVTGFKYVNKTIEPCTISPENIQKQTILFYKKDQNDNIQMIASLPLLTLSQYANGTLHIKSKKKTLEIKGKNHDGKLIFLLPGKFKIDREKEVILHLSYPLTLENKVITKESYPALFRGSTVSIIPDASTGIIAASDRSGKRLMILEQSKTNTRFWGEPVAVTILLLKNRKDFIIKQKPEIIQENSL